MSQILTALVRQGAVAQAEFKAAQGAAPAYHYWLHCKTPVLDGRPRAFHGSALNAEWCAACGLQETIA
jgi:para-nitrobenzyl esterase